MPPLPLGSFIVDALLLGTSEAFTLSVFLLRRMHLHVLLSGTQRYLIVNYVTSFSWSHTNLLFQVSRGPKRGIMWISKVLLAHSVISSEFASRMDIPKISKFEGLYKISDQMWWIALWFIVEDISLLELQIFSNLVAMVTYLNENQWNVQCHRVGDRYFALTSCYSFAIHILTTWSYRVILIVHVSQIDWLCCQIIIWNFQASSRYHKRWENFASQMKI